MYYHTRGRTGQHGYHVTTGNTTLVEGQGQRTYECPNGQGDATCPEACGTVQTRHCCLGHYSGWGSCMPTGKKERVYQVSQEPSNAAPACNPQDGAKEEASCDFNCEGSWGTYTSCTEGRRSRTYSVLHPKKHSGACCDTGYPDDIAPEVGKRMLCGADGRVQRDPTECGKK